MWKSFANQHRFLFAASRRHGACLGDRRGVAAVELALLSPILIVLTTSIVDFGLAIHTRTQVQSAAQAGADYAMLHDFDVNKITNAVTSATTNSGIAASPPPVQACGCPSGTSIGAATCGAQCPNGDNAGTFVTVSTTGSYSTILPYPGIPASFTFTALTEVRIK